MCVYYACHGLTTKVVEVYSGVIISITVLPTAFLVVVHICGMSMCHVANKPYFISKSGRYQALLDLNTFCRKCLSPKYV